MPCVFTLCIRPTTVILYNLILYYYCIRGNNMYYIHLEKIYGTSDCIVVVTGVT